jgi:hypothetical protein
MQALKGALAEVQQALLGAGRIGAPPGMRPRVTALGVQAHRRPATLSASPVARASARPLLLTLDEQFRCRLPRQRIHPVRRMRARLAAADYSRMFTAKEDLGPARGYGRPSWPTAARAIRLMRCLVPC